MLEYRDGHIDEPEPVGDAMRKALERFDELTALHFGTEEELTRQRRRMLDRQIKKLTEQIDRASGGDDE